MVTYKYILQARKQRKYEKEREMMIQEEGAQAFRYAHKQSPLDNNRTDAELSAEGIGLEQCQAQIVEDAMSSRLNKIPQ